VIALVRRRWRAIAYSAALVVAAWAVSTVLKSVLIERPALGEYGYPWNSFPSGHAAVSIAALVAVLWLLPRPPVLLVVPLALLGGLAAASQVVSYAHRLSDVLAGVLLVGVLTAVGLGRSGRLGRLARSLLWGGVLLAAVAGILLILAWETSGYGSAERWPTTIGIALCSTAAAGAVLIVALEGTRHRPA
jgi:membrane-associated phospholipid phosphatase